MMRLRCPLKLRIRKVLVPFPLRIRASLTIAALLLCQPVFAFQSPLSDVSVREAYFLGQRRDESMARVLDQYTRHLSPPQSGPYIAYVTVYTPFALLAQYSSQQTVGYSAQQAALDHRGQPEFVRVIVEILLTDSYGPFIPRPTSSRADSPIGYVERPSSFWTNFDVNVLDKDKTLIPLSQSGKPNYLCHYQVGCTLTGATLQLDFPAEAFPDSATIEVNPPEGDQVIVDFNLGPLR